MDNAADEKQIARRKNKQQELSVTRRTIIAALMSRTDGRAYLWNELSECNVFAQTLSFGRDGYASTAFAEGRRSIGLRLLSDITRWCPQEYLTMTLENSAVNMETQDERSTEPPGESSYEPATDA